MSLWWCTCQSFCSANALLKLTCTVMFCSYLCALIHLDRTCKSLQYHKMSSMGSDVFLYQSPLQHVKQFCWYVYFSGSCGFSYSVLSVVWLPCALELVVQTVKIFCNAALWLFVLTYRVFALTRAILTATVMFMFVQPILWCIRLEETCFEDEETPSLNRCVVIFEREYIFHECIFHSSSMKGKSVAKLWASDREGLFPILLIYGENDEMQNPEGVKGSNSQELYAETCAIVAFWRERCVFWISSRLAWVYQQKSLKETLSYKTFFLNLWFF